MKPVIAILPLIDVQRDSYWMLPGYMDGLMAAGALPQMLPLTTCEADIEDYLAHADGLLMPGGHDVDPALYHEGRLDVCGETYGPLDRMTAIAFRAARRRDMPILGICRGMQAINVLAGGTLWQDLPTQRPGAIDHHMHAPYDAVQHHVDLVPGSPLHGALGVDRLGVNSYHHQGVKDLGSGMEVMARADDGLVEAIHQPGMRFVWGVQWHPELSHRSDPHSRRILRAFAGAAAGYRIR
ncbi:MAG: gamma-glutamyl-gamma-aminobutyrate hydrolase family protein [Bifidobacterium sp.]|nr:gamma-glutamyl-gamma-aminobutyrate hydrolase family protein [Bifidobacterium sp.]